jgi:hypothetical protein
VLAVLLAVILIALGVLNLIHGWINRRKIGFVKGVFIPLLLLAGFVVIASYLMHLN